MRYCVYLTIYRGNRLPPFYIGYTSKDKIDDGYRGSVQSKELKEVWNSELRSHPNHFTTVLISLHERRDDAYRREIEILQKLSVLDKPTMYANRCIGDNRFVNKGGYRLKNATLQKMRKPKSGIHKKRISEAKIGKSCPKLSEVMKGRKRPGIGGVKKGTVPWNKGLKLS